MDISDVLGKDKTEEMVKRFEAENRRYVNTIKAPEAFNFAVTGILRRMEADAEQLYSRSSIRDIVIGGTHDNRAGFLHTRLLTLELKKGKEKFLYTGTPLDGVRPGDELTVHGWEGEILMRPFSLLGERSDGPAFGYVKSKDKPREVFRVELRTPNGVFTYGPASIEYPVPARER